MRLLLVFAAAVLLYLPTARYGFVQDDRAIIAANPAAHSIGAALGGFDAPYWPPPSEGGLYRPLTILSYAIDWTLSGGRPGWLHFMNALWHGLTTVLVVLVMRRWLPGLGAIAAGLVFALHPVHVEGVANVVSRAELLATAGILGGILAARRRWWVVTVTCAAVAMFSKERGVAAGVLILLDDWLQESRARRYPIGLYLALMAVTGAFLVVWAHIGSQATADVAPPFLRSGARERLAIALPASLRAVGLLVWPANLSADYNPQVIPVRTVISLAALAGTLVVVGIPALGLWCRRRAPAIAFGALAAAIACFPTSNLFFASGIVLAERDLYLPVLLVAAVVGHGVLRARWAPRRVGVAVAALAVVLALRSFARLPVWRDNRTHLLTLLEDHPESYRAHQSAAAVLAGIGDTAGARAEYARASELFTRDPHLDAARAFFLLGLGDTAAARALVAHGRDALPRERVAVRAAFLLALGRGDRVGAVALADTALRWFPWEAAWYQDHLP